MKTLNDIYGNKANGQISIKELKAEAVKWVEKSIKEKSEMSPREMAYWVECGKISILKEFFNLTEKEEEK